MQIGEQMQKSDYEYQYPLVQCCPNHGLQTITGFWSKTIFFIFNSNQKCAIIGGPCSLPKFCKIL